MLDTYGMDYAAANINPAQPSVMWKGDTLERILTVDVAEDQKLSGTKQFYAHRVDLQKALIDLATSSDLNLEGPPVAIEYSAHVTAYEPQYGTITLENGTSHRSDLVVAADGIHSSATKALFGHIKEPKYTGTSVVRFMLPTSSMEADPQTAPLVGPGQFNFYVGSDRRRYLLQYPVRNNTEQNFGMYQIGDSSQEADSQASRFNCDHDSLHKELAGFHPSLLGLVPKTSEILPVWRLADRPPLSTWHRQRLVLIGDAAHPMLSNQGQGAAQAIEDGGALGAIFSSMPDSSEASINQRLELFAQVRKGRASVIQLLSRVPYFENAVKAMQSELQTHLPVEQLPGPGGSQDIRRWLYGYDVLAESHRVMALGQ